MDNFIKKIFDGKVDNLVHIQFQKFSKGEFRYKALINVSKVKDRYNISTTYEFASDLVRIVANKIPSGKKVKVSGVVVSTRDLTGELKFKDKKQFMGIKQYIIEDEFSKEDIINLCDKFPNSFLGLSFSVDNTELKIKAKAPKSAKPNTGDKKPTPDFCKIKSSDLGLVKNLLFDITDFKKVEINHTFIINDIIVPKLEKDPAKMREMAIRKGKIIREISLDGNISKKESAFQA
ncbi:MAG TPA: hypothetical protein VI815_01315 [Candidatus Nanoarchaeia archaeon]|nr:hypothetical protein [Candidatus Nanoarchaeia archaeon]